MTKASTTASVNKLADAGLFVDSPDIVVSDDAPVIDPVTENVDLSDLARNEAFMNEDVIVRLATTTDPNAPPVCTITVNHPGNRVQVPRGRPFRMKRCHLEVLARMRQTTYVQPPRNLMDPEPGNELIASHAMPWPFEVLEDKNPRGRAWLEHIMAEAN